MSLKYEPASEPMHISVKYPRPYTRSTAVRFVAPVFMLFMMLVVMEAVIPQRETFIDNLLVRIHFIIIMIRWTGLAPWEFEFPFPGSLTSTFLGFPQIFRGAAPPGRQRGANYLHR